MFRYYWKALVKDYKPSKLCGPKFKNKSYERSNFENNSNFREISELKCLISRKMFGVLTSNFAHLLDRSKSVSKPNFVGQGSKTKKLLSDQILNFGPDFLKIAELWSTYFGIVAKTARRITRPPNIVGQSLKTKKL